MQISRGKFDRLPRTPAEFTPRSLDGYGLRRFVPTRPVRVASDPVSVRQVAGLLHASFKQCLTTSPLHFAIPLAPSGREEDFHLQAANHARQTKKTGQTLGAVQ